MVCARSCKPEVVQIWKCFNLLLVLRFLEWRGGEEDISKMTLILFCVTPRY